MDKLNKIIAGALAFGAASQVACVHEGIGQAGVMMPITVQQRAIDASATFGGGHRAKFPGGTEITSTVDYSNTEDVNGPVTFSTDYIIARMAIAKRFGQPGSVEHIVGGNLLVWNEIGSIDPASAPQPDPVTLFGVGVTYEARFGEKFSIGARVEHLFNSENVGTLLSTYVRYGF